MIATATTQGDLRGLVRSVCAALLTLALTACAGSEATLQPEPKVRDQREMLDQGRPDVNRQALEKANERLRKYADESKPVMEPVQEPGTGVVGDVNFAGNGGSRDGRQSGAEQTGEQGGEDSQTVELEFVNTSLRSIIDLMFERYIDAAYTVLPDYQDKQVNWLVSGRYTQSELLTMFEAFLDLHGVVIDKKGGVYAIGSSPQTANLNGTELGQKTAIFRLDHLQAQAAVQVLRRFVRSSENVQVLADINAVIATGSSSQMKQMDLFLDRVDQPVFDDKTVILYRPANLTPQSLSALVQQLPQKMAGGQDTRTVVDAQPVQGRDLVVIVTQQEMRARVMQFVNQVDRPSGEQRQLFYYTLENQKASEVRSTLTNVLPDMVGGQGNVSIGAHDPTNALLVRAKPSEYFQIKKVIDRIDFTVPSVLIDAAIVEVQLGENMDFGVEWFLDQQFSDVVADVSVDLANQVSGGLTSGVVSLSDNKFAVLDLLQTKTSLSVLSRPRVIVKNGETATIKTVDELKVISSIESSDVQQSGDTGFVRNFETREFGVTLEVTPRISDSGAVSMQVQIEDSRQGGTQQLAGETLPTFNTRELTTDLVAQNGESIFIGGLIQQSQRSDQDRIPFAADIPLLGEAFKNTSRSSDRTELLIFLTPYVMLDEHAARLMSDAIVDTVDQGRPDGAGVQQDE
jgi:general secretion pathway protein D